MTTDTTTPAAPTEADLGPDDVRRDLADAVGRITEMIGAVHPEQLDGPTPCTEMDVRTLLTHVTEALRGVAVLGRGGDPFAERVLPDPVADDAWLDAWLAAAHDVQAVWSDDALLAQPMVLPWMQGPGAAVLGAYVSELTVHGWDLATATGQHPTWDDAVIGRLLDGAEDALPTEGRTEWYARVAEDMGQPPEAMVPPFAEAVPVGPGAAPIDRLVAHFGRTP